MSTPHIYRSRNVMYSVQADHVLIETNDGQTKVLFADIVKVIKAEESVVLRLKEGSAYVGVRGTDRDDFFAELNAARSAAPIQPTQS